MKILHVDTEKKRPSIREDRTAEIFRWDIDNAYPSTIANLIDASVTAKNCVDKSAKAMFGKGTRNGFTIINRKNETLNDVIRSTVREYIKYNNLFLWVHYNANYEVDAVQSVPAQYIRVGRQDDHQYSGKYVYYPNWDYSLKSKSYNRKDFQYIDSFNPIKDIVRAQVEEAGGIRKYKGQILHVQKYPHHIYSLSDAHSIISEMVAESNAGEFKMKGTTDGFIQTKVLVVQPFNNDQDRTDFKKELAEIQGVENAGSIILLESSTATEDLENQLKLKDLTSEHNDKLFEYTENSVEKAICKAFNVPIVMVNPDSQSLFGQSGETYEIVRNIMWQEREEERLKIEEALTRILVHYKDPGILEDGRINIVNNMEDNL